MGHMLAKHNDMRDKLNLVDICNILRSGRAKNIVVMTGPGVYATPEMIDDRFNGEGFYALIETSYDITYSSRVLSSTAYAANPRSFFVCLADVFNLRVKLAEVGFAHKFLYLLHEYGLLRRVYTSNVDSGELRSGLPQEKVVEVYGHLRTAHCLQCNKKYDYRWLRHFMKKENFNPNSGVVSVPRCKCKSRGFIKPDVKLFGDRLDQRFYKLRDEDMKACDLLMVIGTRLRYAPFCELIKMPDRGTPRLYINNVKPQYNGSEDEYNLRKKKIFQRMSDVSVTKYAISETLGDIANMMGFYKEIDDVEIFEVEDILGIPDRTISSTSTDSSSGASDESESTEESSTSESTSS